MKEDMTQYKLFGILEFCNFSLGSPLTITTHVMMLNLVQQLVTIDTFQQHKNMVQYSLLKC